MTKALEQFQYAEALRGLAEEITALLGERKQELSEFVIKTNHMTGELIVNHAGYRKGKHGSGQIIQQLALMTGCSEAHLYFCIQFYEKYREVSNALETLQPDKKNLTWRHIISTFAEAEKEGKEVGEGLGNIKACPHTHTKTITICTACGSRVDDKKKEHTHAANT